jgi:hypothetical protein
MLGLGYLATGREEALPKPLRFGPDADENFRLSLAIALPAKGGDDYDLDIQNVHCALAT